MAGRVYLASVSNSVPSEPASAPLAQSRGILRDLLVVAAVGAGIWVAHRLGRIVLALILAMFFAYVIAPLVALAQHSFLSALVVILAVLAGVELDGIAGIFIAVPVVVLLTVLVRHRLDWRGRDAESLPIATAPS
jgi:predicted PurR-regulated permease PerM